MRSSWQRSAIAALVFTTAMLFILAGVTSAAVTQVQITSPTTENPVYAKPGDEITITADITAGAGEQIWMNGEVGSNTAPNMHVGTGDGAAQSFTVKVNLGSAEPEGWKNISVQAYAIGTPTITDSQANAVCVDTTPPTAPNAFVDPTSPGNGATPTWSWSESTDAVSGLDHYEVQIASSANNNIWGGWADAYPATTIEASWRSAGLTAPGFYKIQVRAVDKAGNASAYAESGVYQFDNAAPTKPGAATVSPASPSQSTWVRWSWGASADNSPGESWQSGLPSEPYLVEITRIRDNDAMTWPASGETVELAISIIDGPYGVRVSARDAAGNQSDWVPGETYFLDITAPPNVGAITGPTSPGNVKRPTWSWAAVDDGTWGSGIKHYVVQIDKGDGDGFGAAAPDTVTGTSWTPNADLADGKYKIRVRAVDNGGLESAEWTESGEYWLDAVPPGNAGDIAVPATPSTVKMPAWMWMPAHDLGGTPISHYSVEIRSGNEGNWAPADPPYELVVEGRTPDWMPDHDLPDGKYLIRVMAFDQAGNNSLGWSTAPREYNLDSTPPAMPGNFGVTPASLGAVDNPIWTWASCADAAGGVGLHSTAPYEVEISADGGGNWAAAVPGAVNATWWTPSGGLTADGSYTIRVRSVDGLSNKSDWGVSGAYVFDTTAPTVPSNITVTPASPSNQLPTWSWTPSTDTGGSGLKLYEVHYSKDNFASYSIAYSYDAPNPPDPSWTATALADGEWRIRVQAIDNANNMSGYVYAPNAYLLDTTGPGAPHTLVNPSPTPGNNTTPTWTWSAPADAGVGLHETAPYEIQIGLDGGDWAEASPATVVSPSWTANPLIAVEGKYKIRVRAVDKLGNKSAYAESGEYWLDTTKPVIDKTTWSEPNNKLFSTGNLMFTVDAYDPNVASIPPVGSGLDKSSGSILAQIVSFLVEPGIGPGFTAGWVLGTDTIQFNIAGAETGTYILQLQVTDLAGNISRQGSLKFYVDLHAPTRPAISYAPYNYDTTPGITWTKSTDIGSSVARYEVQIGTTSCGYEKIAWTSVGNVLALNDDAWATLGVKLEPDGTYFFQLRAVDAVGWTSAVSEVQITVDTVSPVLANGLPTGYGNATPTISAEFTDERSGLSPLPTVLMLTYGGVPTQIPVNKLVGEPAFTAGDLAAKITYTPSAPPSVNGENDGEYIADMTAYDLAGNKSNTLNWKFNVDTTPPTDPGEPYSGNKHDDGTWCINTLRPTFNWAASGDPNAPDGTPGSGLKEYWFQFGAQGSKPMSNTEDTWAAALVDKKSSDPVMPTSGAGTQQWMPAADLPLAVGVEYAARVKALDNVNNASIWVDSPLVYDPHPPTAVTNLTGDLNSENTRPTFTWTAATDAISGVDGYIVKIKRCASLNWDVFNMFVDFPDGASGTITWQIGFELDLDDYVISVAAQDVAGNEGPAVELDFVVEDITGPAAPVVSRLTPSPTNQTEQQWTWTTPFDAVRYDLGKSTDGITDPTTWDNMGNTDIHVTNFTDDGTHYVKVRAYDMHNNAGPWSVAASVEIDRTPPGIPTNLAVPSPTSDNTPTWTWTASTGDVAGYEVVLDGAAAINIGNMTEYTPAPLADGTHSLKVQAFDLLGNKGSWTDEAIVLVDTAPPAVPVMKALPLFTNASVFTFEWAAPSDAVRYEFRYSKDGGATWTDAPDLTDQSYMVNIADVSGGVAVLGKVMAYDGVGNVSGWSDAVQTIIDRTGPIVTMVSPAEPTTTNKPAFTWKWNAKDAGSGVAGYWVSLYGGAASWTTETSVAVTELSAGAHVLTVTAVDRLGNIGIEAQSSVVTVVKAKVFDVKPLEGAYKINEISTISFKVGGLYDGQVKVFVGTTELEAWRVVMINSMPAESRFYVLLDEAVMNSGMMIIGIDVGDGPETFIYEVLTERSGYGFGRLRPW